MTAKAEGEDAVTEGVDDDERKTGAAAGPKVDGEVCGTHYLGAVADLTRKRPTTEAREILKQVFKLLGEQGYNPLDQLVGYLLSGDPAFITSHGDARNVIRQVGRDELLEELVRGFFAEGDH